MTEANVVRVSASVFVTPSRCTSDGDANGITSTINYNNIDSGNNNNNSNSNSNSNNRSSNSGSNSNNNRDSDGNKGRNSNTDNSRNNHVNNNSRDTHRLSKSTSYPIYLNVSTQQRIDNDLRNPIMPPLPSQPLPQPPQSQQQQQQEQQEQQQQQQQQYQPVLMSPSTERTSLVTLLRAKSSSEFHSDEVERKQTTTNHKKKSKTYKSGSEETTKMRRSLSSSKLSNLLNPRDNHELTVAENFNLRTSNTFGKNLAFVKKIGGSRNSPETERYSIYLYLLIYLCI
eukprot:Awhi_evm1s5731